jgi:NAD-dependent SIR2 family protein deacetylase
MHCLAAIEIGKDLLPRRRGADLFWGSCPCGGLRRPGVVWFGEALPDDALIAAQRAVATCDYFISVGTSGGVYPAAGFIEQARGHFGDAAGIHQQDRQHGALGIDVVRKKLVQHFAATSAAADIVIHAMFLIEVQTLVGNDHQKGGHAKGPKS